MKVNKVYMFAGVAVVVSLYLAKQAAGQAWDSVLGGVGDAVDRLLHGPEDAGLNYLEYLEEMRGSNSLNPFIWNPNNVNPADLIPPGYKVNQWGGLERISGGGGASGSW